MTINSSSIPASTTAKSGALLAGLSGDAATAKRSGQNFAQLLGSVTQPTVKLAPPPLPERAPMPRAEVEPPAREPDLPRSTEPVPRAPERAPAQAERSAPPAKPENAGPAVAKAAQPRANPPAKAPATATAAKPNGQADAAASTPASAATDEVEAETPATGKRAGKPAAGDGTDMNAALLGTAVPERPAASLPTDEVALAAPPGGGAAEPQNAPSSAPAADPGSLASLMPSVAQAVFGQAVRDTASASAAGTTTDATAKPVTAGTDDSPLPGADPAAASARPGARAKTEPLDAGPALQAAAGAAAQRTESPTLANAVQESIKALAGDGKPQASAASFGQMLQAAGAAAPVGLSGSQPASAPATPVTVHSSLHEPGFAPEMATRLTLLASEGVQKAQLHLNPAEMGPVSVQIQLDGQQAQVEFHAQHAATREVLERSLPELAAALRDAGMTLSGGGVFQQQRDPQRDGQAQNQAAGQRAAGMNGDTDAALNTGPTTTTRAGQRTQIGVLDMYA